ncbi:tape measure protein [Microbacterium gilvum]|uniref:Tape measure protein n=1 Tax=Microbacterium gilvum TaxID=1336204 RepID=A0ABP9A7K4_9MICO
MAFGSGAEIANAYVALGVKMPGARRDIQTALGQADVGGEGKKAGGLFTAGFAGAVGGIAASLTTTLTSAIGGLASEAIAASDATDKFKSTLDFAGLDTDTIDQLTKSTRDYADATVYDLAEIQNTTAQLAANGIDNYAELTEAAGNLNAVAGGNSDTFSSVAMMLTQTAGAGKLTTENWNQLADAIPGASGIIQKSLADAGAYTGNFRDAMAAGEITAEEFNAALLELGQNDAAVKAATSASTIEGAIGNLQATIVGGFSDMITSGKPAITEMINGLSDLIGMAFEVIDVIKVGFTGNLMEEDSILPLGLVQNLMAFGEFLRGAFDALGPFLGQLMEMLPLVSPLGLVFQLLAPLLPMIVAAFTQLTQILEPLVGNILQALLPTISGIAVVFAQLVAQVLPLLMPLLGEVATLFRALLTPILPLLPMLLQLVQAVLPILVTLFQALVPVIGGVVDALSSVLIPIINTLVDVLGGVITFLTGVFTGDWEKAWQGITDIFTSIFEGVGEIGKGVINGLIDIINGFTAGLNEVGNFVSDVTGGAVDFTIGAIPHLAEGGLVSRSSGGTLAVIGEGRYDEAVVPLSPQVLAALGGGGGGRSVEMNIHPSAGMDETVVGQVAASQLNFALRG